jgi:predicted ribosome quality control (RQC) complex YloA/Tae2 family protein
MQLDALTVAALADELAASLPGARIEDAIQPSPHAVALRCYGGGLNHWLLASAHPQYARVQLLARKPQRLLTEPPPFVMLLRKHLDGARIVAVRQPPWERILEIGYAHGPASTEGAPAVWLVVEMMGRLSNIVLRDGQGTILGALHPVSAQVNRYRALLPNVAYVPPPPQTRPTSGGTAPRLDGLELSGEALQAAVEEALQAPAARPSRLQERTVAALLAGVVLGFGRELGAEVAVRALGDAGAPLTPDLPWEALAAHVRELAALPLTRAWRPTLVYPDAAAPPTAFAVYEPRRFPGALLRPAESVTALLAAVYGDIEWRTAIEGAKRVLRQVLQTQRERCQRKAAILREELRALDEAQRLRLEADILLAFQAEVPAHAASFTIANPFADELAMPEPEVTLMLDPQLTAVENATRRYGRYQKLQRAAGQIPAQIAANDLELAHIEQLWTDLVLAETPDEVGHVHDEVAEAGYLRAAPAKSARGRHRRAGKPGKGQQPGRKTSPGGTPLRVVSGDGIPLLIGKNSRQNEAVTFHEASGSDLWLHARGVPGAHVIVKSGGRPVPESTLREAAALAAWYSQAREAGTVPVDYTQQRYVRHMKGGGPGMVTYEGERTLYVSPAPEQASTAR